MQRLSFGANEMRIVRWGAPHCLRGIVDDRVQTVKAPAKKCAKRLDAGNESEIEAKNVQPPGPLIVVLLFRVPSRRIAREARRRDDRGIAPQQFEHDLVAYFHATAGDKADSAREIARPRAPRVVELGAGRAQLVVKVMQAIEPRLANVAGSRAVQRLAVAFFVVAVGRDGGGGGGIGGGGGGIGGGGIGGGGG